MKKLLKEFKAFITRGNVIDLAVGMIIGAAFTAIVTALVNSIFKPLINWIPIGEGISGLRTVLGTAAYLDNGTVDWANTNYIDWGAFLMASVNFLLTALVLFAIIQLINTARKGLGGLKKDAVFVASITPEEKAMVGGKLNRKNLKLIAEKRAEDKAAQEAADKAKAEADAQAAIAEAEAKAAKAEAEKQELMEILREIRDSLKKE